MAGHNSNPPTPFPQAPGVPILGQPFQLKNIYCPVTANLSCTCGGAETDVAIVASVPGTCPSCHKIFNIAFNPTTMKLEVLMMVPTEEKVPS
jgi:hypothetical protein